MRLLNLQKKLLVEALLSAFVTFTQLRNMILVELDDPLDSINPNLSKAEGVVEVLKWATAEGKLDALSTALIRTRPNNPAVITYRNSVAGGAYVAAAPVWPGKASGLEALVKQENKLLLADEWAGAMKRAQSRVCRIEFSLEKPIGTAFLVGSDLVLTNCHVYREMEKGAAYARFDFYSDNAKSVTVPIEKESLAVSTEDKLDFALLRLNDAVEPQRGKFSPKKHEFKINEVQLILQHANGRPLQIGIGQVTAILPTPERVIYNTNTEPGSSGSPVFTADWELVAIHHFGDLRNNIGIPITPIWELLDASGHI